MNAKSFRKLTGLLSAFSRGEHVDVSVFPKSKRLCRLCCESLVARRVELLLLQGETFLTCAEFTGVSPATCARHLHKCMTAAFRASVAEARRRRGVCPFRRRTERSYPLGERIKGDSN